MCDRDLFPLLPLLPSAWGADGPWGTAHSPPLATRSQPPRGGAGELPPALNNGDDMSEWSRKTCGTVNYVANKACKQLGDGKRNAASCPAWALVADSAQPDHIDQAEHR